MPSSSIEAIFTKVALTVEHAVGVDRTALSPATRLVEDLQLGRFARLRLVVCLEESFRMELSDEAIGSFSTLGDIARHISRWWLLNPEDLAPLPDLDHDRVAIQPRSGLTGLSRQTISRWICEVAAFVGTRRASRGCGQIANRHFHLVNTFVDIS